MTSIASDGSGSVKYDVHGLSGSDMYDVHGLSGYPLVLTL